VERLERLERAAGVCTWAVPLVKHGEMQYDLLEMIHQIANKPGLQTVFFASQIRCAPALRDG
jgi:hypothetical protein